MRMKHKKWNISYELMTADKLINLSPEQATAMAELYNRIARQGAEAQFLLSCNENEGVPDDLKNEWPKVEDYVQVQD